MHILSAVIRFLIYGLSGSSVILIISLVLSGRTDPDIIFTPVTYFTFLVPGVLGIFLTKNFETRKQNLNINGAVSGAKITFFSFFILGTFIAIATTDTSSGIDETFGKAWAGFVIAFTFLVWAFLPLGALTGIIVNHIDAWLYKRFTGHSLNIKEVE